jgi:ice-binding like protein/Big-like domain-containing protein
MKFMRSYNNFKICFMAVLLLVFTGCNDPDKSTGAIKGLTPPIVSSVAPPNATIGGCPNTIVTATFSEAMNPATINGTTFTVTGPSAVAVTGVVTYDASSDTAIFTPSSTLALNTAYTGTITTGAKDSFGNALASNFVWTFTTANTTCQPGPPTVISVAPPNGSSGICANAVVVATFSEAMNPSTINTTTFTLAGASAVTGVVTYDAASHAATFTPASNLALSTLYTATITTGAQDLFGNPLASDHVWSFTTAALSCNASTVPLGSAANFVVLAGSTVTSTSTVATPTIISGGDLGLSPGSSVTGFPPGMVLPPGVMHITDPTAAQAQLDLTTAYNYAAGLPGGAVLAGDMSSLTFTPGLYKTSSTVMLSAGNVTLDAQGNANAVFIFQVGSTLTTLGSTQVVLANGAQAKNVFWQVGSSATLGTNSIFMGTIMALQAITLDHGATLTGRALARNAAVTLDTNTVTGP